MCVVIKKIIPFFVFYVCFGFLLISCGKDPLASVANNSEKYAALRKTEKTQDKPVLSADNEKLKDPDLVRILTRLPSFELTNQEGKNIGMTDLHGRVWIANFIFTRCTDTCPLQTQKMNELQTTFKEYKKAWKDIRLVSFSVDPEHDTSDVLSKYIGERKLDTSQWHFLTGSRDSVWNLSKKGFRLPVMDEAKNTKMPILHSSQFVLVDWEGRIRGYYDALNPESFGQLQKDTAQVYNERTFVPADVADSGWVSERKEKQLESAKKMDIFSDFKFSDERENTDISFRHSILDDVGSNYKAVHYDHGTAISVADIDLDGFYDIYFTTLTGSNELWRNLGNGKFENITKKSGLFVDDRIGVGASFADIDNDGDQDLYITNVRTGNLLFENDGKGYFKDITQTSGTGVKAHSSGSIFFDYNKDGLLDLFVTNVGKYTSDEKAFTTVYSDYGQVISNYEYYLGYKDAFAGHLKPKRAEPSVLFKNLGNNRFEDVTEKMNIIDHGWNGEAAILDGNNDGWPDIYVLNMQGHDSYYENVEGREFIRKSREVFPKTPWGAMGAKVFDYDNDGDMDLYVTDMHSDMSQHILGIKKEKEKSNVIYSESFLNSGGNSIFGNAFYRNDGDGTFSEVSDELNVENYWPWGPSLGDFNADGFEDIFVASSMSYPFRYSANSLFLNNKGKGFIDSEYIVGVEPRKHNLTAAPSFELDCFDRNKGHRVCGNKTKGRKVVWGALGTRSSVVFDLDQDGDQDIVTLEFNQPPMVLVNNLNEKTNINYLKVSLVGRESNRSGIGAKVRVFSGEDVYTKIQDGKSGYLSQSFYPLYFGLGANKTINKIEIVWPSGKTQKISKNISLNTLMRITEPKF